MQPAPPEAILVTGAAGFIGSHVVDRLLERGHTVIGVDNLSRGKLAHLEAATSSAHFRFIEEDVQTLTASFLKQHSVRTVWHLAANSDIAAGQADAAIDLRDTFQTTFSLLGAMRSANVRRIVFASSSAVYGVHAERLNENSGPLVPISNYGAMKLASEGLLSAASEAFLERCWIFRFANICGPRSTHGILHDLLQKVSAKPTGLQVLGNGSQRKPYLYVGELVAAMLLALDHATDPFNCFLLGPADDGLTVREIAELILQFTRAPMRLEFGTELQGWPGDVPFFRYSIDKIRTLGWEPQMTSRQAVSRTLTELLNP